MAAEKLGQKPGPKRSFEEMLEHASTFLSSASNIWKNPSAAAKKIVLKLAFTSVWNTRVNRVFEHRKLTCHSRCCGIFCRVKAEWRTERDSNPRYGFPYTRVPGVRLQPLGHLSVRSGLAAWSGRNIPRWTRSARTGGKFFPAFQGVAASGPQRVAGCRRKWRKAAVF